MPLPTPTRYCPICGDELEGRADKIFCSSSCKNEYHSRRKAEHLPFSEPIDKILHRNWVILKEHFDQIGKRKFFLSKAELNKAGFHTQYYTTTKMNSKGKLYYYVYNFGWMDFSDKQMMVIKMEKSQ